MTTEKPAPALDAALKSLLLKGDVSELGPEERSRYYLEMCEGLGLNPHSQPFAYLRLNGKEILYATRGATDQLAAIHKLNREIVDGPKLVDLAGTKLVFAVCRATHPNGRIETATATVPFVDPVNALMKCETKAKRRATLSILGLGLLDEMELETIPASAQEPGGAVDLGASKGKAAEKKTEQPKTDEAERPEPPCAEMHPALEAFYSRVNEIELPGEGVSVWMKHRAELGALKAADRENAWRALCKKVEVVGKIKDAKVWLKKAIAEEDARRGATSQPTPDPNAPQGSRAWANFVPAIASAPTVAAVVELYAGLQRDLHEEGEDANRYVQDTEEGKGAGTMARERVFDLGHRLSSAELQELLVNEEFARLLDTQATIAALPQAAAWWRRNRGAAQKLTNRARDGLYYGLARRLAEGADVGATKRSVAALKAAVEAADKADGPKPPGGGGGSPAPTAPTNATAQGDQARPRVEGSAAVGALRAALVEKPSAGAVAGSWWKHRAEFSECSAEARAAVIDELERRQVEDAATYLDAIGRKNGYLPPLAQEQQAA